jgi:plastocyanin
MKAQYLKPVGLARALALALALTLGLLTQDVSAQAPAHAVVNFGEPHPQHEPPANHILVPDEVTIAKGGLVTFVVNGGAHSIAIYPVSKNTTRAHIEEDLCQRYVVECSQAAGTQSLRYLITDGDGNLVIDTGINPPEGRVNYAPGQLMSAGAGQFLVGSTAAGAAGTKSGIAFPRTAGIS